MRRSRSTVFVAINFWDVVCLLVIAAIFNSGFVAISRHGAYGESTREYYSIHSTPQQAERPPYGC